ncbi:MAG: LacI family DNA-binding transcriptional regulator [Proteocatella sp.]
MQKKKATIKDVAVAAGISIGTVDRVMHNRGGVSKKTEEKIRKIASELNYTPSAIAQALVSQKNNIRIAVIYPDAEPHFWSQVEKGIKDFEKAYCFFGVELIVYKTSCYAIDEQIRILEELKDSNINGVVTIPYNSYKIDPVINELVKKGIIVNTFVSDAPNSKRSCYTGLDDISAGVLAANQMGMLLCGQGKIAVVGVHRDVLCIENRILGFLSAIHKDYQGIELLRIFNTRMLSDAHENLYIDEMIELTNHVLDTNPVLNGIYVTNSMTEHVAKIVKERGKGHEIRIVGHELSNDINLLISEGVIDTSIYQNQRKVVYDALKNTYKQFSSRNDELEQFNYTFPNIVTKDNVKFIKDIYKHKDIID